VITVQVDPFGSDTWRLDQIVDLIKNGGVGVIPTDTVYAIVCDLKHREAIDRLYRIKNMDPKKVSFVYNFDPTAVMGALGH
jgi:tRNA A37 threonylcarbamoyladenosine synthetase subunit TsaC/SUA5/YrdC